MDDILVAKPTRAPVRPMLWTNPPTQESSPWLWLGLVLLMMGSLWVVIFTVLPPSQQDFPLNDDWAYAKGFFSWFRGEGIHYYRQPSMPLLGQWLWAWPFVQVLGASHGVLRFSTIVLSLAGIAAFFDLLRQEAGMSPPKAAFVAAALGLNPLFFLMAGTYMSDIPSLSFSLVALALYARALRSDRLSWLAAATAITILAAITRQNAIAIPMAVAVLAWQSPGRRWHPGWLLAIGLPTVATLGVNAWFSARPDAVPLGPSARLDQSLMVTFSGLHLLGLAALPVLALCRSSVFRRLVFGVAVFLLAWAAIYAVWGGKVRYGSLFPYLPNILSPWGPLDSKIYVPGDKPVLMAWGIRLALTILGCVSGAALVVRLASRFCKCCPGLLSLFTLVHFLLLMIAPVAFDRYILVLVPGILALAAGVPAIELRWKAGVAVLTVFAALALGMEHDWLAWNTARWELGRRALARGIAATDIEGGLEWDSWFSPNQVAPDGLDLPARGLMLPFNRARFPEITGQFALTFTELSGTLRRDAEPYSLWLLPGPRQFLLVEQKDAASR